MDSTQESKQKNFITNQSFFQPTPAAIKEIRSAVDDIVSMKYSKSFDNAMYDLKNLLRSIESELSLVNKLGKNTTQQSLTNAFENYKAQLTFITLNILDCSQVPEELIIKYATAQEMGDSYSKITSLHEPYLTNLCLKRCAELKTQLLTESAKSCTLM